MDRTGDPTRDGRARVDTPRPADLTRLFAPQTVAVVGASDTPGRPTTLNWRMVKRWAERCGASIFPVNPKRETVDDLACVASLDDLDRPIDVVILLISDVVSGLEAAARIDAGFVIVFAAGFAEMGEDGAAAQAALLALLDGSNTRMLGPNTNMNAFEEHRHDLGGPAIALISQSGHQGRPIFMLQDNGVRVTHWAPTGNEADLELADFATYFADDPEVGAVAAYLEGLRDGRTFRRAAERCIATNTPMTVVKVGRNEVGRASAASHTGKLSGSDRVADGLFRQLGVTRVDTLDQLGDTATLLARGPKPRATGVAVYSISGGTGAHLSDLCVSGGLDLPRFGDEAQQELHQWIPEYLQVANPIDCGGHPVGDERGMKILEAIAANPDIGVLLVPIMGPFPPLSDRLAEDLVALAERTDLAVCVLWGSPSGNEAALTDTLRGSEKLVVFRSAANAVGSIRAWLDWHEFRDARLAADAAAPADAVPAPADPARRAAAIAMLAGGGALSEHRSKELLGLYGLHTGDDVLATSADEALAAARTLGFPVVMKACSSAIAHKSELGLVVTGITEDDAVATYQRLVEGAEAAAPGEVEGVLVCRQVGSGIEMVIGIDDDPTFGPTVMLGTGGILVELLDDVTFRVPPFDRGEANRMVDELAGAPLLDGLRGRPRADREALLDALLAVQDLAVDLDGHLAELDINPIVVLAEGEGVVALDALAVARAAPATDR